MLNTQRTLHINTQTLSISGTFRATLSGKYEFFPILCVGKSSGFAIPVVKKPKKKAPKPKPATTAPTTAPFYLGNHSHPQMIGTKYTIPMPIG